MTERTTAQRLGNGAGTGFGAVMFLFPLEAIIIRVGTPMVWLGNNAQHHWGFGAVAASMAAIVLGVPFLAGFVAGFAETQKSTRGNVRGGYLPGSTPNPHPWQSVRWYAHETLMEQERQTAALNRRDD